MDNSITLYASITNPSDMKDSVVHSDREMDFGITKNIRYWQEIHIGFSSIKQLADFFCPNILKILSLIRKERPQSISELARIANMNQGNVSGYVTQLANFELIYFIDGKRNAKSLRTYINKIVVNTEFEIG